MKTSVIIVDDFYGNPDIVRSFALQQQFDITGNYPGARTKTFLTEDVKEVIQKTVKTHSGEINNWFATDGFSGSFQLTTAEDRSWIHTDHFNSWAGVCYLTPDAPHTGGTGLFKHKATGAMTIKEMPKDYKYEARDMTKWDLVDVIGNKYNRLVLYRSDIFHSSLDYFGSNATNGRLFQLFFFNTEF